MWEGAEQGNLFHGAQNAGQARPLTCSEPSQGVALLRTLNAAAGHACQEVSDLRWTHKLKLRAVRKPAHGGEPLACQVAHVSAPQSLVPCHSLLRRKGVGKDSCRVTGDSTMLLPACESPRLLGVRLPWELAAVPKIPGWLNPEKHSFKWLRKGICA